MGFCDYFEALELVRRIPSRQGRLQRLICPRIALTLLGGQVRVEQEMLLVLLLAWRNLLKHAYAVPVARPHALHPLPLLGVNQVPCADDCVDSSSLLIGRRRGLTTLLLHYQTVLLARSE